MDYKRRCVFIGTTNKSDGYLTGQTGNTRFLPIQITKVDHDEIMEAREQLLAEAKEVYLNNPKDWWVPPKELVTELGQQRDLRRVRSVYEDSLSDWLDGIGSSDTLNPRTYKHETTWQEIAQGFLNIDRKDWKDKSLQMQVTDALKALGWTRKPATRTSKWIRPE